MNRLLIGDNMHIDFSSPLEIPEGQSSSEFAKEFVNFLKTVFEPSVVELQEISSFRPHNKRLGDMKSYPTSWTDAELSYMVRSFKTPEEVSEAIGRSGMAVLRMYAKIISDFSIWQIKNQGDPIMSRDLEQQLIKFLNERKNPNEAVVKIANQIKEIKNANGVPQWPFHIQNKEGHKIILEKLGMKEEGTNFRKAIQMLRKDSIYKQYVE